MQIRLALLLTIITLSSSNQLCAQKKSKPKSSVQFQWVNSLPGNVHEAVQHSKFKSKANKTEVGYCILLPPEYTKPEMKSKRFPVVYWLHGGRPGGETKAISMAKLIAPLMNEGDIPPMIYVFPNGGRMSHYDYEQYLGEQAFLELIDHVDSTYRTIADRTGRAVEGFSQGGRGTGRYMFKHPNLFCSAAPLGGGQQHEKRINENDGKESESFSVEPAWNNTWALASRYANQKDAPKLRVFIAVGDEDFNYEANKEWSQYLKELGIEHEFVIVPGVPHSSQKMYEKIGKQIVQFHVESFRKSAILK